MGDAVTPLVAKALESWRQSPKKDADYWQDNNFWTFANRGKEYSNSFPPRGEVKKAPGYRLGKGAEVKAK